MTEAFALEDAVALMARRFSLLYETAICSNGVRSAIQIR